MACGDSSSRGYAAAVMRQSAAADEGAAEASTGGDASPTVAAAAYLDELVRDANALDRIIDEPSAPPELRHVRRVLTQEVSRVWGSLYSQSAGDAPAAAPPLTVAVAKPRHAAAPVLSEASMNGARELVSLSETVAVPLEQFPGYNFIGRILGPRGMSVKQLEQVTGCKILIRGRGSVKDAEREERLSGRPGWEHLTQPLHVLVTVEDERWRAVRKLATAVAAVRRLLEPVQTDDYKRRQLEQLAIINGNYRPTQSPRSDMPFL